MYSQFCACPRSQSLLPGKSLHSSGKAAALQQLEAFQVWYLLLAVVTNFITPRAEIAGKIGVSQRAALHWATSGRKVNNGTGTIISNRFLPMTTQLNTSKSVNKPSTLNPSAQPSTD